MAGDDQMRGHGDEIAESVAAQVADEAVLAQGLLFATGDNRRRLELALAQRAALPGLATLENVHAARVGNRSHLDPRLPDHEVRAAVSVEIADRTARSEFAEGVRALDLDPGRAAGEITSAQDLAPGLAALQDVGRSVAGEAGRADEEVRLAITVEIPEREGGAEVGTGGGPDPDAEAIADLAFASENHHDATLMVPASRGETRSAGDDLGLAIAVEVGDEELRSEVFDALTLDDVLGRGDAKLPRDEEEHDGEQALPH